MEDKNYFIMLAECPWAGPSSELVSGPDIRVYNGEKIEDVGVPFHFLLKVDKNATNPLDFTPCDIHGPNRCLLFSERFINLLASLEVDNIQYIDAKVIYEPTRTNFSYKVANIIGITGALDLTRSHVILGPTGNVAVIEKLYLEEKKILGQKIFRLKEDLMLIIVHKSIKEAVEAAGLTGFLFMRDDEYV